MSIIAKINGFDVSIEIHGVRDSVDRDAIEAAAITRMADWDFSPLVWNAERDGFADECGANAMTDALNDHIRSTCLDGWHDTSDVWLSIAAKGV